MLHYNAVIELIQELKNLHNLGGRELHVCLTMFVFQPMEVYVDDDSKLTLHGLQQHYVKLKDQEKNRKLFELLDALEFNQVRDSSAAFDLKFCTCENRLYV